MKSQNNNRKLSLAALLFAVLVMTPAAMAATITTDQEDYGPDEIVYISGSGFDIYSVITVTIVGPEEWGMDQFDSLSSPWWVYWSFEEPDRFNIAYLKEKCEGTFTVTATDGTNTATKTFTDDVGISNVYSSDLTYPPEKNSFLTSDNIYAAIISSSGSGSQTFRIYVVSPLPPAGGILTDVSGGYETVTILVQGTHGPYLIWATPATPGTYYIVVDINENGLLGGSEPYDSFTVSAPPAPTVTDVSPDSGNQGEILTGVIITGTNLTGATVVSFGAGITVDSFTVDSGTQITVDITIDAGAALGFRDVSVTTPGGTGTLIEGFSVTLETTPPDTQILTHPADPTNSDSASFTWTGSDNVTPTGNLVYSYRLDGGGWSLWASSTTTTYSSLADGPHTFEVKAKDEAGNEDPTPASWTWNIDATPPTVTIDIPDYINIANVATVPVTITSNEDGEYDYVISDGIIDVTGSGVISGGTPVILSLDLSSLADGPVTADAAVEDAVGNIGYAIQDNAFKDTVAPTLTKDLDGTEGEDGWYTSDVTVTLIGDDPDDPEGSGSGLDRVEYNLNGGGWTPYTVPFSITTEGINTLGHRAYDNAGNEYVLPEQEIKIDKTPPTVTKYLNGELPGGYYAGSVEVTFTADDGVNGSGVASIEYSFDGTTWIEYDNSNPPIISAVGAIEFWHRATDNAGNVSEEVQQFIILLPKSAVTTSSLCPFDVDPDLDGQQFRLIFTQDPTNISTYKLTASNPGQFFYNVFYIGTPGETANLIIDVPDPFVTQGAMPVHVYASVSIDGECFIPADEIAVLAAQTDNDPDYEITVEVPDTGLVYVAIHLDYGLKKTVGYSKDMGNNAEQPIGTDVIGDLTDYDFSVSGGMSDVQTVQNQNVFKRNPGFGGIVTDSGGNPIPGETVQIFGPAGNLLGTVTTDVDGFYFFYYKHKGKDATFTVVCSGQSVPVVMKANRFVEVNFIVP